MGLLCVGFFPKFQKVRKIGKIKKSPKITLRFGDLLGPEDGEENRIRPPFIVQIDRKRISQKPSYPSQKRFFRHHELLKPKKQAKNHQNHPKWPK